MIMYHNYMSVSLVTSVCVHPFVCISVLQGWVTASCLSSTQLAAWLLQSLYLPYTQYIIAERSEANKRVQCQPTYVYIYIYIYIGIYIYVG